MTFAGGIATNLVEAVRSVAHEMRTANLMAAVVFDKDYTGEVNDDPLDEIRERLGLDDERS